MELIRLTERIWYYPCEEERDRPILGYIKGDNWSMAVDAGHSGDHTAEFYEALKKEGLPMPGMTVLTHWHWDHTFGMHSVEGMCVSNSLTCEYLKEFKERIDSNGINEFLQLDECIRREYAANKLVLIVFPDIVFTDELTLDAGNCPIKLFRCPAPHTDDSTLVWVKDENVLFLGDAAAGVFPTWEKDPELCRELAKTIADTNAEICVESHCEPQTASEVIADLYKAAEQNICILV